MPRYTFDVHDNGPAEWGEETLDGAGRDEIERHARRLIGQAQARQREHDETESLITVFVHHEGDGIVLTAYGRPGEDVRLVWAVGYRPGAKAKREGADGGAPSRERAAPTATHARLSFNAEEAHPDSSPAENDRLR